ncbi:MAG: toll/interleukin-1 receptor domain-containing protein, partial [Candidatus Acidiferrales bacterium]
ADSSRPTQLARSTDSQAEDEPPSFWQPGCFRLFISHTAANKESAHRLKEGLAQYHIAAFVAHDDIEPAKEWESEIERALRTTDALAAIITSDFAASRWCDQEVGYALGRGKPVLPLCKDAVIPHGFLGKYQACKARGLPTATVAEQVYNLLLNNELTFQRMSDAVVDRMVTSGSFDTSRRTMKLLEKLPRLSDSQVTKLIQASETNSQVFSADGITSRIQRLVKRVGKSV